MKRKGPPYSKRTTLVFTFTLTNDSSGVFGTPMRSKNIPSKNIVIYSRHFKSNNCIRSLKLQIPSLTGKIIISFSFLHFIAHLLVFGYVRITFHMIIILQ